MRNSCYSVWDTLMNASIRLTNPFSIFTDTMFEDKLHFDFATMQEVIRRIGILDAFRGKWQAVEQKNNRYLRELRRVATIESIGSSTRIEGAVLTNERLFHRRTIGRNGIDFSPLSKVGCN